MGAEQYAGWEKVKTLGAGGQSDVFLVRSPERAIEREGCWQRMRDAIDRSKMNDLAEASWAYARPDNDSELGALKIFKVKRRDVLGLQLPDAAADIAVERLKNEIKILRQNRPGLPRLLAHDTGNYWIVTEWFRDGSLEKQLPKYKNNVTLALKAFRSLVSTVSSLHEERVVHRDIKPANIFVRQDEELVLGDFGIAYLPDARDRITATSERVGPRDYMPSWADMGERLEEVEPCSDVYMLGKLLWCLLSGRLKLPREKHREASFDLTVMFPNTPDMERINLILDKCIVEEAHQCLSSAKDLLEVVDKTIASIAKGTPELMRDGNLHLVCEVCRRGVYKPHTRNGVGVLFKQFEFEPSMMFLSDMMVRVFTCSVCTHFALFAMGNPDEAVRRLS